MLQTFSLSTDAIAPRDRYAYWTETVSRNLTGMRIECPNADRPRFFAKASGVRLAESALIDIERSGDPIHRDEQDIRNRPGDNLLLCLPTRNKSWFRAHGRHDFVAPPGSIVLGYSDVPFSHSPIGVEAYRHRFVSLSVNLIGAFRRERRVTDGLTIPTASGIGALMLSQVEALARNLADLSPEATEIALRCIGQLAALAQGSVAARHEASRDAIVAGQLASAERWMSRHMQRPDLAPEVVAGMLGISVRSLHALFEPTGKSFSRRLREMRLERARGLLRDQPTLPIIDVALGAGFDNLATFYRVFKAAFGMTATEYRLTAREPSPH